MNQAHKWSDAAVYTGRWHRTTEEIDGNVHKQKLKAEAIFVGSKQGAAGLVDRAGNAGYSGCSQTGEVRARADSPDGPKQPRRCTWCWA